MILKLYIKLTTGYCRSNVCLVGKTAIITGANTGTYYKLISKLKDKYQKEIVQKQKLTVQTTRVSHKSIFSL